jgi:DNA-binding NtrC family response regulator
MKREFNMSRFKILLVDDSESILKSLVRVFRPEGYEVFTALSAKEAVDILEKDDIDLIISDQNMPGISGNELLNTVRTLYPDVIRIMLTGCTDIEVAKQAINSGQIYRFFNKPWDDFELTVAVRHALAQKALEKENDKLRSTIKSQQEQLEQLEKEYPGISSRNVDRDGAWIIE